MTLQVTATQTAPDAWSFTVAGVTADEFVIDYGDGSAPVTTPVDVSGTTVVAHTYLTPGHHDYTVTVTAQVEPLAATLQALATLYPGTLTDINTGVPTLQAIGGDVDTVALDVTVDVGPATIWATVQAGTPPTVRIDTVVGNAATVTGWTVTRSVPGDAAPVWIGTTHSGAMSFVDITAPLGVPITYRLNLTYANGTAAAVTAAPVTITGTSGCFVTDPFSGASTPVEIARWPARRRDARRAVLEVLGRADPVVVSDVHSTPTGAVTFLTRTDASTAQLVAVLTASGFAVIRTQPGSSMPPAVTVSVGEINEERHTGAGGDQTRLVEVTVQEIADLPATALPVTSTLDGLADLAATLDGLRALRPTLLQLSMIETAA